MLAGEHGLMCLNAARDIQNCCAQVSMMEQQNNAMAEENMRLRNEMAAMPSAQATSEQRHAEIKAAIEDVSKKLDSMVPEPKAGEK